MAYQLACDERLGEAALLSLSLSLALALALALVLVLVGLIPVVLLSRTLRASSP